MNECIFCKIAAGEIPCYKIFENDEMLAFLDIVPVNPGHVLIIPKKHFSDFLDTPEEIISAMIPIAKKIGQKIIDEKIGEGFNIQINCKKSAGQVVNHFHLHIIPRFSGDGRQLWHGKEYAENDTEKIAEKLK